MGKKWTKCVSCDFQAECLVCKARLENYDKTTKASDDIGCYDLEMIKKQRKRELEEQQLKLFKI